MTMRIAHRDDYHKAMAGICMLHAAYNCAHDKHKTAKAKAAAEAEEEVDTDNPQDNDRKPYSNPDTHLDLGACNVRILSSTLEWMMVQAGCNAFQGFAHCLHKFLTLYAPREWAQGFEIDVHALEHRIAIHLALMYAAGHDLQISLHTLSILRGLART